MEHKYLNLGMGLIEENFVIVKKKDRKLWEERGFEKIGKYPVFGYLPKPTEMIMLGKPLTIKQFGIENIKGSRILDICTCLGTYGMGGPGFVGIKLEGEFGVRWLVYCIWAAGEHILLDDRVLECHPKYADRYKPWIDFDNEKESIEELMQFLRGATIQDISLAEDELHIVLTQKAGDEHFIHTQKLSNKFPEQGGTGKKRNSYDKGVMEDYWLVIYDTTELMV
ncbi:MAG: hypothetical protein IJ379_11040 [Lachnospiraceae bacterium]|nr:hypothetical protein [Lachnospiraceae bacterium]